MSRKSKGLDRIDSGTFAEMLEAALSEIKELGGAKAGDKTMIDCLEPAVFGFRAALQNGGDFKTALTDMKSAAETGRDSTKALIARIGRASRLGERSRGVPDAGATSCCMILCAMADAVEFILVSD